MSRRADWHHGATGKTLLPTLPVGTPTNLGVIVQVRKKKKYPKRYLIDANHGGYMAHRFWCRRDEFRLGGQ